MLQFGWGDVQGDLHIVEDYSIGLNIIRKPVVMQLFHITSSPGSSPPGARTPSFQNVHAGGGGGGGGGGGRGASCSP